MTSLMTQRQRQVENARHILRKLQDSLSRIENPNKTLVEVVNTLWLVDAKLALSGKILRAQDFAKPKTYQWGNYQPE